MKTVAVMQPYFMPYIGYFQLASVCDELIVLDDDYFKPRGWVHRNKIQIGGRAQWFTIPVQQSSQNKKISDIEVVPHDLWCSKHMARLRHAYGKAQNYESIVLPIMKILRSNNRLIDLLMLTLGAVFNHLEISMPVRLASDLEESHGKSGVDRVLAICKARSATRYVNLPGGKGIYDPEKFNQVGVNLKFVVPRKSALQKTDGLSALHYLCLLSRTDVEGALAQFDLE